MPHVLIPFQFDPATVQLIVRGLSKLPYEEVADTIKAIVEHADASLNPPKPTRKKKEPAAPVA